MLDVYWIQCFFSPAIFDLYKKIILEDRYHARSVAVYRSMLIPESFWEMVYLKSAQLWIYKILFMNSAATRGVSPSIYIGATH
jgi:hypothetical protein